MKHFCVAIQQRLHRNMRKMPGGQLFDFCQRDGWESTVILSLPYLVPKIHREQNLTFPPNHLQITRLAVARSGSGEYFMAMTDWPVKYR